MGLRKLFVGGSFFILGIIPTRMTLFRLNLSVLSKFKITVEVDSDLIDRIDFPDGDLTDFIKSWPHCFRYCFKGWFGNFTNEHFLDSFSPRSLTVHCSISYSVQHFMHTTYFLKNEFSNEMNTKFLEMYCKMYPEQRHQ